MLSYGLKSYLPIRLLDFSECSVSLTTWVFGMIVVGIFSVSEVLLFVLEIEKEILLLLYRIPGPLGILLMTFFY